MNFGSFEILALIMIFFILFGADRLPKLAKAMGQSKGEFQKGYRKRHQSILQKQLLIWNQAA